MNSDRSAHGTYVSVGYQGRRPQELAEALRDRGVEVLIDVRLVPWSQRPEFRKNALAAVLAEHGIAYRHYKAGGNPFKPKRGEVRSVAECARQYGAHLDANPGVVAGLMGEVDGRTCAVLCFEAEHEQCHRSILLERLTAAAPAVRVAHVAPRAAVAPPAKKARRRVAAPTAG
jgi:uncharacterized protein (DUF488 family)